MFQTKIQNVSDSNKTTRKPNIPITVSFYFLTAQLCFGIDYGFTKNVKTNYQRFVKVYSATISLLISLILFIPMVNMYYDWWIWLVAFDYCAYLIILKTSNYTIYDFILKIYEVYGTNPIKKKILMFLAVGNPLFFLFAKCLSGTIVCISMRKAYCPNYDMPIFYFYFLPSLGLEFIDSTTTIIYFHIYCCITKLKELLESEINFTDFKNQYIAIANCYDKIKPVTDKLKLLQLFIGIPKLVTTLWSALFYMKATAWYLYTLEIVFVTDNIAQIFIPAVVAELTNSQMDNIKIILNEQVSMEKPEEKKSVKVTHLLRYMEVRRLDHPAFRFIPLDLKLLTALFSLCISYTIVIIQFTHLYG